MSGALQKALARAFAAPKPRIRDAHRSARAKAMNLARELGCEIESLQPGSGMNVWPPKGMSDERDPFAGDHHAEDWSMALQMLSQYREALEATPTRAPA